MLSVQKQGLVLRMKEVERDHAELTLNKGIAQQSIEAQERDLRHSREEGTKRQKTHQNFLCIITFLLLVFAGGAIYTGNATLVLDILKIVVGFLGGMGYQAYKASKKPAKSDKVEGDDD